MQMPGRHGNTSDYRYGFQGQETDDEVTGSESHVAFKYRVHDARLGRFLSVDPLSASYPHNSPYAFSENRVINGVELEGLEFVITIHSPMLTRAFLKAYDADDLFEMRRILYYATIMREFPDDYAQRVTVESYDRYPEGNRAANVEYAPALMGSDVAVRFSWWNNYEDRSEINKGPSEILFSGTENNLYGNKHLPIDSKSSKFLQHTAPNAPDHYAGGDLQIFQLGARAFGESTTIANGNMKVYGYLELAVNITTTDGTFAFGVDVGTLIGTYLGDDLLNNGLSDLGGFYYSRDGETFSNGKWIISSVVWSLDHTSKSDRQQAYDAVLGDVQGLMHIEIKDGGIKKESRKVFDGTIDDYR
jgi:RHS repeat-associated protein